MLLLYRATLIGIDGRVLTIPTEGSRVGCQSIAVVDKGKKREGVRFKLVVQFKEPGSNDSN